MTDSSSLRETTTLALPLRLADLSARGTVKFRLLPDPEARATLAGLMGVQKLRKLEFSGTLTPDGRYDWRLAGRLGATAVQDCVITFEPVTTRIDTDVTRRFVRDMPEITSDDLEIPEDDTLEPLGPVIDPGVVMAEALALALPDYPRAEGADLGQGLQVAPKGAAPLQRNAFAALAALKRDAD